jgi:outer membrane lipoprotein SlyB
VNRVTAAIAAASVTAVLGGCAAAGLGSGSYDRGEPHRDQTVRMGVVESLREVKLGDTRRGLEITAKLESGQMLAIVQETDETFQPGDRVRILSDGATARVTR